MIGFGNIVTKIFGKKSDKDLKSLWPYVEKINQHYNGLNSLTDQELKDRFVEIQGQYQELIQNIKNEFKDQEIQTNELDEKIGIAEKDFLDNHMIEVFAIVKDAARRLVGQKFKVMGQDMEWNMVHYDVQLIGGIVLHQGRIAEMKTGEGKTLVSTLAIVLNALTQRGVHVITVNDYLAERDSAWMGFLFNFLGLSVGCILQQMPSDDRKRMYGKDITYGTNSEFGFDYLRDNLSTHPGQQVQRSHFFTIVDEVDSVLIDEARTPLIISGLVSNTENKGYYDWKSKVEQLFRSQRQAVNTLVTEAETLLENNDKDAAALKLLTAFRGLPKNKKLLKIFQQQGTKQLVYQLESEYIRDKKLSEIDNELLFTIEERSDVVDLCERGREYLAPDDPNNFVIPDIGETYHDIDADKKSTAKEKMAKKEQAQLLHAERSDRIHAINQLLKAYALFEKDIEYIVQEGKVKIVDVHTGRVMHGRRYSDGLHQALQAKENVNIEKETQTVATITIQNYFKMYEKLAGMTGTAFTEAQEFMEIYKLDVVEIPTNVIIQRIDHEDVIYKTKREKYNAVVEKINDLYAKGQPVLVGTTSVDESEVLSRMLQRAKIPHNVLNAKQHQKEAEVVLRAGQKGAVTIATNMAGRGTDIRLGEEVSELGGLFILGTGRHESRRIDLQLRGRSGRQGDAGESIFFLSLEDDLMRVFGSERVAKVMDRMGVEEGEVITHSLVTKSIERAQTKVEARYFAMRKHLVEYDEVMNQQRQIVYDRRNFALNESDVSEELLNIHNEYMEYLNDTFCADSNNVQDWDFDALSAEIIDVFSIDLESYRDKIEDMKSLNNILDKESKALLTYRKDSIGEDIFQNFQKFVIIQTISEKWQNHLYSMDQLREGINLRSYGQKNPLLEYKKEGFGMFREMMLDTNTETLKRIFRTQIQPQNQNIQNSQRIQNMQAQHDQTASMRNIAPPVQQGQSAQPNQLQPQQLAQQPKRTPIQVEEKVGRNQPCPCGSGKKYKKCHGAN